VPHSKKEASRDSGLRSRLRNLWLRWIRLPLNVRHVGGPRRARNAEDELSVVCLAKDAEIYIVPFIEHYLKLGVKHIVVLDNDSTDATRARASRFAEVTVLRTTVPFRNNNVAMRQYLLRRFGQRNRWLLCVDVDELFDYPYSDRVPIASLLRYLRSRSFTALVAYQLDLFSDRPLSDTPSDLPTLRESFRCYDISAVRKIGYFEEDVYGGEMFAASNRLGSARVKRYLGGIRLQVFDLPEVYLIKHPLVFLDGKVRLVHQHFACRAHVADITGVLYHYKFVHGFAARVDAAVDARSYANDSWEYRHYRAVLDKQPDLCLKQETVQRLESVDELVDQDFLQVSPEYERWAAASEPRVSTTGAERART